MKKFHANDEKKNETHTIPSYNMYIIFDNFQSSFVFFIFATKTTITNAITGIVTVPSTIRNI